MTPIQLEGATQFGKPEGWEGEMGTLPVVIKDGLMTSVWTFTDEERAKIARGQNVSVQIMAQVVNPIRLTVVDVVEPRSEPMISIVEVHAIQTAIDKIMADNPDKVIQARLNPQLNGWFVGKVMQALNGRPNADAVNMIVRKKISESAKS